MKQYKLFTGSSVWLAPAHITSVAANSTGRGSIIRMSNGDQWAVTADPEDVVADLESEK